MDAYMDERWKLSKKGSRNSNSSSSSSSRRSTSSSSDSGGSLPRRSSSRPKARKTNSQRSFTNRCASLVKEQRAKFYIMRRCVTMLICWSD